MFVKLSICSFLTSFVNFCVKNLHSSFAFFRWWHGSGVYVIPCSLVQVFVSLHIRSGGSLVDTFRLPIQELLVPSYTPAIL